MEHSDVLRKREEREELKRKRSEDERSEVKLFFTHPHALEVKINGDDYIESIQTFIFYSYTTRFT